MANVPTQLSPGVNITEIDLSGIVREAGNNTSGFVGQFRWGPASQSLTIDTESRLTDIFLTPNQVSNNIKADNDFFSATNYLRYSDKLKIVRVINENSKNAGCCAAAAILVHNEESFFKLADPTSNGSKNYAIVEPNSPWIARYPGDVGNSIKVIAIGSGQFIQGSVNNGENGGGGGGGNGGGGGVQPPVIEPRSFILKKNGSLVTGVHQAFVTVPVLENVVSILSEASAGASLGDWARAMIGDGSTLPSGNTFGVRYLCFFMRGSSYCSVPNTFPIPGGTYGDIPQSIGALGLSYDAFYRDNYFFGEPGEGTDQTDGGVWTENGPILAARLQTGITLSSGGSSVYRGYAHGKGFWNRMGDIGAWTHQCINSRYTSPNLVQDGGIWTAHMTRGEVTYIPKPYGVNLNPKYPSAQEDPGIIFLNRPKFNTTANIFGNANIYGSYQMYTPQCLMLPIDNTMVAGITEAYVNDYFNAGELAGNTYLYGSQLLSTGGLLGPRTATAYRNMNPTGGRLWKWTGSGVTWSTTDNSCFPLRAVIDAFGPQGITAATTRGMILMFAIPQTVVGITSGRLSTWDFGITPGSSLGIAKIPSGVTTDISGITAWQDINNPYANDPAGYQLFFGFRGDYDTSFATSPEIGNEGLLIDSQADPAALDAIYYGDVNGNGGIRGAAAFPILESEWANVQDIKIFKSPSL